MSHNRMPLSISAFSLLTVLSLSTMAQPMTFETAWQRLQTDSDKLAAADAAVQSKLFQVQGLQGLGGPTVSVSANAFAYNATLAVNLDSVNQRINQLEQQLPIPLQSLPIPLSVPQLPSTYSFNRQSTASNASVSAVWPIYVGGATGAVRLFAKAQVSEAQADAAQTTHELATLLVQRYFGAQLAQQAARLRQAALDDIVQHDAAIGKMLTAGVISRMEQLQTKVALEDARRNALKAHDDAELAATALARTVKAQAPVSASSPLFVLSEGIEPLSYFVDASQLHHPGLAKVAARKAQAEQLHESGEALRKPQIFAFGRRELQTGPADWVAGIGVRWTLFDAIDRNAMAASSQKRIEQADHTDAQARSDIALLVEKNWHAVINGQRQFSATQPGTELAAEVLRLRTVALREGTGTALELIDAEVNQAKVKTERAQAAYDYVLALARLLESCGLSDQFQTYITRADITLP
jgi:outer membrane protein TolC